MKNIEIKDLNLLQVACEVSVRGQMSVQIPRKWTGERSVSIPTLMAPTANQLLARRHAVEAAAARYLYKMGTVSFIKADSYYAAVAAIDAAKAEADAAFEAIDLVAEKAAFSERLKLALNKEGISDEEIFSKLNAKFPEKLNIETSFEVYAFPGLNTPKELEDVIKNSEENARLCAWESMMKKGLFQIYSAACRGYSDMKEKGALGAWAQKYIQSTLSDLSEPGTPASLLRMAKKLKETSEEPTELSFQLLGVAVFNEAKNITGLAEEMDMSRIDVSEEAAEALKGLLADEVN